MLLLKKLTALMVVLLTTLSVFSQKVNKDASAMQSEKPYYKYSVITTWHSFLNGVGDNLEMYELHLGYKLTPKDKVGIKTVHWKLMRPLGIPLTDPNLTSAEENYPGRLREFGVGAFYQRMLWKGLFASIEVVPLKKSYLDTNNKKIADGFRLYTSYHLGYQFTFFNNRLFIEPQVHCNYWPINTNAPEAFKAGDQRWNNYFLFEPNLYIGINF